MDAGGVFRFHIVVFSSAANSGAIGKEEKAARWKRKRRPSGFGGKLTLNEKIIEKRKFSTKRAPRSLWVPSLKPVNENNWNRFRKPAFSIGAKVPGRETFRQRSIVQDRDMDTRKAYSAVATFIARLAGPLCRRIRAGEWTAPPARNQTDQTRRLARLGHELRTPLNGILGTVSLLAATPLTPQQRDHLQTIEMSGRLLLSLLDEILEQARSEASARRHAPAPFDPVRLVEETCELLAPRAHARGLQIASFIAPQVCSKWIGDPLALKQVLLNLVGNAIKFTVHGGVLVSLKHTRKGLHFFIRDTGPGVPEHMQRRIFDPFARHEGLDTTREGGAGLGLAICREIVDGMGGTLSLDNHPGKGATFHFTLPLRPLSPCARQMQGVLRHRTFLLHMAPGPVREAVQRYVAAFGGTARAITLNADEDVLFANHCDDILIDAHGARSLLRRMPTLCVRRRCWLILRPEERIHFEPLLQKRKFAGYLLAPLRRETFLRQLLRHDHEKGKEQAPHAAGGGRKPLVLLAEDDPVSARITSALLRREGYEVREFGDGESLLAWLKAHRAQQPLAVLLDLHMPNMDGLATLHALRSLHEVDSAGPRIIGLSAGDGAEQARALAAGMHAFLRKPVEPEALLLALNEKADEAAPEPSATHRDHARPVQAPPSCKTMQT